MSEISLGSWLTYGVHTGLDETRQCIACAIDQGVNFFDTANMYGLGAAETTLGLALSRYSRADYLLATKVYFPMSDSDQGLSREQIHKQIDASLKRLGTDYVDLYQCHRYDDNTPLEETMEAMTEVLNAGKARYIGFSGWTPRQIKHANRLKQVARFVSSSPQYSMLRRRPERRLFPLCEQLGIGQIVWSPLAQGVLSGKYRPHHVAPSDSRAGRRTTARKMRRFTQLPVLTAVQELHSVAAELSLTLPQLALAWVLRQKVVSSAIIGASKPQHIAENVAAVGVRLDSAACEAIDKILADVMET